MDMRDAEEIAAAARVDPTYFSIGSERHEALCVVAHGQCWHVFLYERGERFEEQAFESEDAAAVYFLKRLFQLWRPR